MTNFNITYATLCSLMDRSYTSFKILYPDEEPWWKIQCLRKKKHERPSISKADKDHQWRKLSIESSEIKSIEKVDLSGFKHKVINKKITREQKYIVDDVKKSRIGKPHEIIEVTSKEQVVSSMDLELKGDVIDVCMERSQPNVIQHTIIDTKSRILSTEEIMIWGKIKSGAWVDVNMETSVDQILKIGKDMLEFESKKQDDNQKTLIQLENIKLEFRELEKKYNDMQVKFEESSKNASDLKFELSKKENEIKEMAILKSFGDSVTIEKKYHDIQLKLNKCKQDVMAIMNKYTVIKYQDLIKEHGFILSIPPLVRFFDDDYQDPSPYNSDDDGE